MLFGEIVEPNTRALIEDDFEEYPDYVRPNLDWEGDSNLPASIDTIIFIESNKLIKLFKAFVIDSKTLQCKLQNGKLEIYRLENDKFIISYEQKELVTGEIIEIIAEWLKKSRNIYAITSESISAYQNSKLVEKLEVLVRQLSYGADGCYPSKKLESPNLVSGLGADILSFCIHSDLKCVLYVVFMDNSPLDSKNTSKIIKLMKSLDLVPREIQQNLNPEPSNLYV